MSSVTINGNTYSADGSTPKDMLNGGHRTYFIPLCSDVATVAGQVQNNADQVAIDAVNAADGANAVRGTSTTSTAVGAGSKTFTTQAGKQFTGGNYVTVSRTSAPTTLMHGVVTAYSGTALTVDVSTIAGSGTYTDWTIALSGAKGNNGPSGTGDLPYVTKTSAYTVLSTDKGKLIDCTSGTFTLSFSACATLGANWATYIRNSGTGTITLDPNGSETINGAATYTLNAGSTVLLLCDGTSIRSVFVVLNELVRLPIFSPETTTAKPASCLEDIFNTYPDTLLGSFLVTQVCFGASLFVASASGNPLSNVSTSPDGVTWTLRAMPSSKGWSVGTDGTGFVACVPLSTTVARSTNATTWAAGTSLPGVASGQARPLVVGGISLVMSSVASTFYRSTDYGNTAWSTQTTPTAMNGSMYGTAGGLFWYYQSTTTAFTSPTGLTGSWTSRSIPIAPQQVWNDQDGALWIKATGTQAYKTTDGVNWVGMGYGLANNDGFLTVNGVDFLPNSTFGGTKTLANGLVAVRRSEQQVSFYSPYCVGAKNGNVHVFHGGGVADGRVCLLDITAPDAPTALFTR